MKIKGWVTALLPRCSLHVHQIEHVPYRKHHFNKKSPLKADMFKNLLLTTSPTVTFRWHKTLFIKPFPFFFFFFLLFRIPLPTTFPNNGGAASSFPPIMRPDKTSALIKFSSIYSQIYYLWKRTVLLKA